MIEMKYVPRSGEVPYSTGPMKAGVPVLFEWRTPATGVVNKGANGRLQMVAPPGNNASFTAKLQGIARTGQGQTSFQWPFGEGTGRVPQADDTVYSGEITADSDCDGCTLKLTAR